MFIHTCAPSTKYKPAAASFSGESCPVSKAGHHAGHQGWVTWAPARHVSRTSPSENTERSCSFNFCLHSSMSLEKINKILLEVNFKLHMLAEWWNPLSQVQGLYAVSLQPSFT